MVYTERVLIVEDFNKMFTILGADVFLLHIYLTNERRAVTSIMTHQMFDLARYVYEHARSCICFAHVLGFARYVYEHANSCTGVWSVNNSVQNMCCMDKYYNTVLYYVWVCHC